MSLPPFLRHFCLKRLFDLAAERRGYSSPELQRVVANSQMVGGALVRRYPGLKGKIEVVYNGCDVERFNPENATRWREATARELGLDPHRLTGIHVGYRSRRKGVGHAIAAVALAKRRDQGLKNIQLVVVGGGHDRACRRQVERLGIPDDVKFTGET
ncbi:MAG: hypothetical protein QME96_19090, partial [Myxococcota bacterium]|nr:hypothetical protein [Myxococcota bacterium]